MQKLVAPNIDELLFHFDRGWQNREKPTQELIDAMNPLFDALRDLAPFKKNDEAKGIWIVVPVGELSDYGSFEDAKAYGEAETIEEFEQKWKEEYPDPVKWYRLTVAENKPDSRFKFKSVSIDNTNVIAADMENGVREEAWFKDEAQVELCQLLAEAAKQSMERLRAGTYNDFVAQNLPYQHRYGVIRRSDEWKVFPEERQRIWKGVGANTFLAFKSFVETNESYGRIRSFTANDFFRACVIGYRACGYDLDGLSPSRAYLRYADGRDEGLTGTGHGLNEGPGIDFDDPQAWNEWYNGPRGGGHPWEVIRGGNSTHVDLYVEQDDDDVKSLFFSGQISKDEYKQRMSDSGYYFAVAGTNRPEEAVCFFVALREAGMPVTLYAAEEILARFEGTDYIGIVPHHVFPAYCGDMFPEEYGNVVDFMHVFSEEADLLPYITWIPEEPAYLRDDV